MGKTNNGSRNTRTRGWRRQAWKRVKSYDKSEEKAKWVRGRDEHGPYIQEPTGKRRKYRIAEVEE